jgi:tetrahydromethanopterin S-methyltransferase subunit E
MRIPFVFYMPCSDYRNAPQMYNTVRYLNDKVCVKPLSQSAWPALQCTTRRAVPRKIMMHLALADGFFTWHCTHLWSLYTCNGAKFTEKAEADTQLDGALL